MRPVKVLTDSVSDIPKVLREQYDIDYLLCSIVWDGKELPANLDWALYSAKDFYNAMRDGKRITTCQVAPPEFEEKFNKYVGEGYDIVYVACSSALSASVGTGSLVAAKIMEQNPDCKIICVDTKMAVGGLALLAIEAAKFAAQGHGADEVAEHMEKVSPCMNQWATVDDLRYLKRAGRVKAGAAFFGNLFGIKPILISDANGMNYAIRKVKGRKNAMEDCIQSLKESICYEGNPYPVSEQTIYVGHADCLEDAEACAERIKEVINPKDVFINYIGPIVGSTVGPGTIAIYGFGKEVTVVSSED